jgi:hypothetical protein
VVDEGSETMSDFETCPIGTMARLRELEAAARAQAAWPIRGVRVDGDTVIVTVKGGNDAARWLCGELLAGGQPASQPTQFAGGPPWLLPMDVAVRVGNEHRVRVAAVQDVAHAVHALREASRPTREPLDERAAFEAWAGAEGFCLHRDDSEKYRDYHRATTRWAWEAWQARAHNIGSPGAKQTEPKGEK